MPTYDYECQIEECGHTFEAFQSIRARPLRKCPECGGKVKRLIGAGAGLIFKGSGFYITDYRSKEYTEKANADKPPSDSTSSDSKSDSSDTKSDSKDSDSGKKDSGKTAKAKKEKD